MEAIAMRQWTLVTALAVFPVLAAAQTQPRPTPTPDHHERKPDEVFRKQELSRGVYVLYGKGGNIGFLVGQDAVLVVDSEFKELVPGILSQIKSVSDKPVKYLVNTHHHGDHTGGNEGFKPFAVILAHENVRKRMLASPQTILKEYPAYLEEAKKKGNQEDIKFLEDALAWAKKVKVEEIAAPVVTYESGIRIHVGDETISVWHTPPAHTDGDSVILFENAKVLHMGDLFFHKIIPFIDVSAGGSAKGYAAAIDSVIARVPPDVKIIPGHGEATDLAGLREARQYIADVLDAAQKAKAAGKTKEQFLASVDLPQYKAYDGYGERFKDNCAAAWDESAK
jgi:glyoxylase-like metal-dependent hydrolase (beta-lactamase superfamily II)